MSNKPQKPQLNIGAVSGRFSVKISEIIALRERMKEINTNYSKLILIAFAIVGIVITFWLIGGTFSFKGALSYSLSSIVTGLIFKLNYKK